MILNGNQRGYGQELARHLLNAHNNEHVELHQLRGFLSHDLAGALQEIEAISKGTKCRQYLYSLSLNPPRGKEVLPGDFETAIDQAEARLGLAGQPRAVVFHIKDGRRHAHVVWSRIDVQTMKARQMSHDREKLTALSRELFLEHGWEMPRGLEQRGERDPLNYDYVHAKQAERAAKDPKQIKRDIQEAWACSDCKASFEQALAERGYMLARGDRRSYVAVDMQGEIYSIPRMLGIKTKEVRARLGDPEHLPSLEQVRTLLADKQQAQKSYSLTDALERITRYHAAFTENMAERSLKPVIKSDMERQRIIKELLTGDALIKIGNHHGKTVYTTAAMQQLEQQLCNMAEKMISHASHPVRQQHITQAITSLNATILADTDGKGSLSEQQQVALGHMAGDRQLSLVVGVAGAGKTTIMAGSMQALQEQSYRVRGAAPSGIAASGLKEIGMEASTLHSLEAQIVTAQAMLDDNSGKPLTAKQRDYIQRTLLSSKDVLIVDEAGMVSAQQLSRIMQLCQQSGAKLVLVGDPQQLQSIEAGKAFQTLLERHTSVSLTEVRRQQPAWQREATIKFSAKDIAGGLQDYARRGCVSINHKTRKDAKEALVREMIQAQEKEPDRARLVLAYTRQDVHDLNTLIKAEMVRRGAVARADTIVMITEKDGDADIQRDQGFAVGDRILFRENNKEMGVMNGTFGTLKAINHGQFYVELDNKRTISFNPAEYNRFQLGYAATVHKSQGVTVDEAYVLASPHFDQHTTYVALSRHKHTAKLYGCRRDFKNRQRLFTMLGKESEKLSTLEFVASKTKEQAQSLVQKLWQKLRRTPKSKTPEVTPYPDTPPRWIEAPSAITRQPPSPFLTKNRNTPLSYSDISRLRDTQLKAAQSHRAQQRSPQRQPDHPPRGPSPER